MKCGLLLVLVVAALVSAGVCQARDPITASQDKGEADLSAEESPAEDNASKDDAQVDSDSEEGEKKDDPVARLIDMESMRKWMQALAEHGTDSASGSQEVDKAAEMVDLENMRKIMQALADMGIEWNDVDSEDGEENPEEALDMLLPLPEEPAVELTPEEKEIEDIYQGAMAILNKTQGNKKAGYDLLSHAADQGHKEAQVKLAWARLFGNHVPQNISLAREGFQALAETGHPEAHTGLGLLYAAGVGINVSQAHALIHLTLGALGDSTWAQMALGYRHWAGVSLPVSCEKALTYYRKAASKVAGEVSFSGGPVVQRIRLLDEQENSGFSSGFLHIDLFEYYQLIAEKGDIPTQVGLGQLHYQGGRGVPLDIQKAMHYFSQAANAGNPEAMAFLGKIYLEGSDAVPANNETALRFFQKAAELNNPVGQSGLGLMYLHGMGVTKDTHQALKYFKLAADQGWVDGQLQLANMYFGGIGVRRDYKLANKYFSLASQSGHVLAVYHLGLMHAQGLGMMPSCPTAVELFKNVAERGKWGEQLMLAYNDNKQFNDNKAFVQYAIMAQLGYEVAQSNAAFLLDRGDVTLFGGPPEDYVRALTYWSRAASQGYSSAQVKLGDYHYYGLGTVVDYEAAASHYRLASEQQHNAQAMFNLGYMHEQGLGMRRDVHLAKRCYDLAAQTSTDAKVPVALALFKLAVMFHLESLHDSPLSILVDESFISNWDIYLITALTVVLGAVIYFRRPLPPQRN